MGLILGLPSLKTIQNGRFDNCNIDSIQLFDLRQMNYFLFLVEDGFLPNGFFELRVVLLKVLLLLAELDFFGADAFGFGLD